jgi:hypothetical protein
MRLRLSNAELETAIAAEQMRRIWRVWVSTRPSDSAVRCAIQRLLHSPPRRRSFAPQAMLAWAAAGALLGVALCAGASPIARAVDLLTPASPPPLARIVEKDVRRPLRGRPAHVERPEELTPTAPLSPVPLPAKQGHLSTATATRVSRGERSAWHDAARALEQNDHPRAERALAELSASPDQPTRDAAELARAQLWVSRGKPDQARPVLEWLAVRGATPLIRRRAAEILSSMR